MIAMRPLRLRIVLSAWQWQRRMPLLPPAATAGSSGPLPPISCCTAPSCRAPHTCSCCGPSTCGRRWRRGPAARRHHLAPRLPAWNLCLALSTGELLLLSSGASSGSTGGSRDRQPEVEEVGAVDGGLAAAAWSPDGELLALVSGTGSLLLMNRVGGCRPRRGTCCPHACLLGRTLLHC